MKVVASYPYTFAMIGLILALWVGCGSISKNVQARDINLPAPKSILFDQSLDTTIKHNVSPVTTPGLTDNTKDTKIEDLYLRSLKAYDNVDSIVKIMPTVLTTLTQVMQRTQELRIQNDSLKQQQILWHNESIRQHEQVVVAKKSERIAVEENINTHQASNNIIVTTCLFAIFMSILSIFINRYYIRKYGHRFKHI